MTSTFSSIDDFRRFLAVTLEDTGVPDAARGEVAKIIERALINQHDTDSLGRLIGGRIIVRDKEIDFIKEVVPSIVSAAVTSGVVGSGVAVLGAVISVSLNLLFGLLRRGVTLDRSDAQVVDSLPLTREGAVNVQELIALLNQKYPTGDWTVEKAGQRLEGLRAVQCRDGAVVPVAAEQDGRWYRGP